MRPLCRQLLATSELELPDDLPMVLEAESGFHFRRRGSRLVLAMTDPEPRWGFDEVVDETLFDDRLERLRHRYPAAAEATIEDAWAGLYDMTPDAHPILGEVADGVYAACGFSGHGFMQSPAVGRALAEEILGESPSLDLGPYRLSRFERGRRVSRDASSLARTPRRPRGPCRSAHVRARPARLPPENEIRPKRSPSGSEIQRSPSGSVGQLRAQLVDRRHRVRKVPEQQADGHSSGTPGVGSFAISSLISRSTSASLCPKSSR